MKKYTLSLLLAVVICHRTVGQTISINGTVKTAQGDALYLAFVQDKQYKSGTYTDSLGNFMVQVNPNSKLKVSCRGFKPKVIDIDGKTAFSIVLETIVNIAGNRSDIPATVDENSNIAEANLRDMLQLDQPTLLFRRQSAWDKMWGGKKYSVRGANTVDMAPGAIFPQFTHTEDTKGSRFFLIKWGHGFVINAKDSLIHSSVFLFNYDKISGNLMLTKDTTQALQINRESIKSFTLIDESNQQYTFTIIPAIDQTHFVQVIASGNNYSIFKLTKTEFIKANFNSDGVMSSGNHYDEYADEATYYVIGKSGVLQKIALKKKSLKEAFNDNQTKLNQYFATNNGDIDDNYLKDLGDYVNK